VECPIHLSPQCDFGEFIATTDTSVNEELFDDVDFIEVIADDSRVTRYTGQVHIIPQRW
jgi:hypothetical protein